MGFQGIYSIRQSQEVSNQNGLFIPSSYQLESQQQNSLRTSGDKAEQLRTTFKYISTAQHLSKMVVVRIEEVE